MFRREWDGHWDRMVKKIPELRPHGLSWVSPKDDGDNLALVKWFCWWVDHIQLAQRLFLSWQGTVWDYRELSLNRKETRRKTKLFWNQRGKKKWEGTSWLGQWMKSEDVGGSPSSPCQLERRQKSLTHFRFFKCKTQMFIPPSSETFCWSKKMGVKVLCKIRKLFQNVL